MQLCDQYMLCQFREYVMEESFSCIFSIRYKIIENTQENSHEQNKFPNVHIC